MSGDTLCLFEFFFLPRVLSGSGFIGKAYARVIAII